MYIVNTNIIRVLDARKMNKSESDSVHKSVENCLSSTPDGPATIMVKHLDDLGSEDEEPCYKKLRDVIDNHPEHIFLIEEKFADPLENSVGPRVPPNVWFGDIGIPNLNGNIAPERKTPRWLIVMNPNNIPEAQYTETLDGYKWIIINTKVAEEDDDKLKAIAGLQRYCNSKAKYVCAYPTIDLRKLDKVLPVLVKVKPAPIYNELPITETHTLIMKPDGLEERVQKANINIQNYAPLFRKSTMIIAFTLYNLQQQARQVGQQAFWMTYFGVSSFVKFAVKVVELSGSQAYRYIQAVHVSEILAPGKMSKILSSKEVIPLQVLSYSRFLSVSKYLPDIEASSDEKKNQVRDKLFDHNVTSSELKEFLADNFAKPATIRRIEPFNIKLFLKDVAMDLSHHFDGAYFNNLVLYIAAIDQMFTHCEHNSELTEPPAAVSIEGNTPLDVALVEEWHLNL
jgi:hypothetical protein